MPPARARAAAALVLLAGLAGCGSQAGIPPCPGQVVATLQFSGTLVDGTGCLFDWNGSGQPPAYRHQATAFTAQVALGDAGEAWVCPQRTDARPLSGTLTGDHLRVATLGVVTSVPACGCGLRVDEVLEGDLTRDDTGAVTGFAAGLLQDDAAEQDPAGPQCEPQPTPTTPSPPATCGVPCTMQWTVTGAP